MIGLRRSICFGWLAPSSGVDVRKIWDRAPHNAFTDLIRFRGRWYCVFREGEKHVSRDGSLRVIASTDGSSWKSAAHLTSSTADLRDPKVSITPGGRLMLTAAGALHQPNAHRHQTYAWFSDDGERWSDPAPIGEPDYWLWRVAWHEGTAYAAGYGTTEQNRGTRLYKSTDGVVFTSLVANLRLDGFPNESTIRFMPDGTAMCLMRRDANHASALLGEARPPFTEWTWHELGARLGGPNFIRTPGGKLLAAGRLHDGRTRTALAWIDTSAWKLTEFLSLPSGGDSSYPGLVWHQNVLWVSYYSSHEGKTSIYLARVRLNSV
ncbi:MAG: exo-alpha-sialidase [Bryobacterales bacterium]|nr:exo-alpha-sialidase [Bryobacterales bacterium]